MANEWDGMERRNKPHEYELRSIIREEIKSLQDNQETMKAKIAEWEAGARWLRLFIIGTIGFISLLTGVYEWLRLHLK